MTKLRATVTDDLGKKIGEVFLHSGPFAREIIDLLKNWEKAETDYYGNRVSKETAQQIVAGAITSDKIGNNPPVDSPAPQWPEKLGG